MIVSGRVIGMGIDIVECRRIEESIERFGDRFLKRVFVDNEVAYAKKMKFPERHLAARFAAKEAVSKAFGTGISGKLGWKDIEVARRESGEPYLILHGAGMELLKTRGASGILISLSHSDNYAVASAMLVAA